MEEHDEIVYKDDINNICNDKASYVKWLNSDGASNTRDMENLKKALPIAIKELTQVQQNYLNDYFYQRLTVGEIANKYEVDHSTVSRMLKSAMTELHKMLRFTAPSLYDSKLDK